MQRGFKSKCENLALQIRYELGLKKTDSLSPESLAEYLGVYLLKPSDISGLSQETLLQLKKDRGAWSAVTISLGEVDVVIYNPFHSRARWSSDIMHELSHILLGHKPIEMMLFSKDVNIDIVLREYNRELEDEANWLAWCLLLPREALLWIKKQAISDDEACDIYGVSHDVLNFRMNKTGVNYQVRAYR